MPRYNSSPAALIQEFLSRIPAESLLDSRFTFNRDLENPPTSAVLVTECMKSMLYNKCQLEDLELAKVLVRPSGLFVEDLSKESLLTKEKSGSVERVFVIYPEDKMNKEEFQRFVIDNYHPKEVRIITSAEDMVMLSKPGELSQSLEDIADEYAQAYLLASVNCFS